MKNRLPRPNVHAFIPGLIFGLGPLYTFITLIGITAAIAGLWAYFGSTSAGSYKVSGWSFVFPQISGPTDFVDMLPYLLVTMILVTLMYGFMMLPSRAHGRRRGGTMRVDTLTNKQTIGIIGLFLIATLTLIIEYVFHFLETSPMEVPAYFIAIFIAAVIAALFISQYGILVGALVFTIIKTIYYAIAIVFSIGGLTVWTQSYTFTILGITASGTWISIAALEVVAVEFVVHAVIFAVAALIVVGAGFKKWV